MSTEQGKKIDEIKIDWDTKLIVRYHADDRSFSVEAGDQRFKGDILKPLIEQGEVHIKGWSKLTWEPIIVVDTEIYSEIIFTYGRLFHSKHKKADVYRSWKIGEENEGTFGSNYRDDEKKTGDILKGEPGQVVNRPRGNRILPFTADRWTQLRKLSQMLKDAMEAARVKLSELLKQKDLDGFLADIGTLKAPGLEFTKK